MLRSESDGEPERLAAALRGLRAYQDARREEAQTPPLVAARAGRARLLDFGGSGRAVVFVPSLINGPEILDLSPERSLMRWLATRGVRPLLVDWGSPDPGDSGLSIADHVETMLHPMLRTMPTDHALAGYCLGGTMAIAAASLWPPSALALIAAPWRFGAFPRSASEGLAVSWREAAPAVDALGLLPPEVLQAGFWRLDPARTVDKFVRLGAQASDAAALRAFVAVEDWANGGAPLTAAAGRELVHDLFGADVTGRGLWQVAGRAIDPGALGCPVLDIASTVDRIVPAASAAGVGRSLPLDLGHIGMIVGGRARAALWEPLAAWLRNPN